MAREDWTNEFVELAKKETSPESPSTGKILALIAERDELRDTCRLVRDIIRQSLTRTRYSETEPLIAQQLKAAAAWLDHALNSK